MLNRTLLSFFCLGLPAISGACHAQVSAPESSSTPLSTAPGSLDRGLPVVVKVKTDKKVYRPGDSIKMTMTVQNNRKQPVMLTFNSGQRFDFEIRKGKKPAGERVWEWAQGRMFTMSFSSQPLAVGQTLTFTQTATPTDSSNPKANLSLLPGEYTIQAVLTTGGRDPRPFGTTLIHVK